MYRPGTNTPIQQKTGTLLDHGCGWRAWQPHAPNDRLALVPDREHHKTTPPSWHDRGGPWPGSNESGDTAGPSATCATMATETLRTYWERFYSAYSASSRRTLAPLSGCIRPSSSAALLGAVDQLTMIRPVAVAHACGYRMAPC